MQHDNDITENFLCPITQVVLIDPVIAADGHTYERRAIERWISERGARAISPMTGKRLEHRDLIENSMVRKQLREWPERGQRKLLDSDITTALKLRKKELEAKLKKQIGRKPRRKIVKQELTLFEKIQQQANAHHHQRSGIASHMLSLLTRESEHQDITQTNAANRLKRFFIHHRLKKWIHQSDLEKGRASLVSQIIQKQSDHEALVEQLQQALSAHSQAGAASLNDLKKHYHDQIMKKMESGELDRVAQLALKLKANQAIHHQKQEAERKKIEQDYEAQISESQAQIPPCEIELKRAKTAKTDKKAKLLKWAHYLKKLNNRLEAGELKGLSIACEQREITSHLLSELIDFQGSQLRLLVADDIGAEKAALESAVEKSFYALESQRKQSEERQAKLEASYGRYRHAKIAPEAQREAVEKLLTLVARGDQDEAEEMLKKHNTLLFCKGDVTDLSERQFKEVTAFQYAIWALDWHMWRMILKYLPSETALVQMDEWEANPQHGGYFDFQPLLAAYKSYIDHYQHWSKDQCAKHWSPVVGVEQRHCPAHVLLEYTTPDHPLFPVPAFNGTERPSEHEEKSVIWAIKSKEGLQRGRKSECWTKRMPSLNLVATGRGGMHDVCREIMCDHLAITQLFNIRTDNLRELQQQLSSKPSPTNNFVNVAPNSLPSKDLKKPISKRKLKRLRKGANKHPLLSQFLEHVAKGNQDQAESLLKKAPELVLGYGDVTDYSKRTFKGITGLQYTIWALDVYMFRMIQPYFKKIGCSFELGRQSLEWETTSQLYVGKKGFPMKEGEDHFDFTPSRQAYHVYLNNYERLNKKKNWGALERLWVKGIGGNQALWPAHYVLEMTTQDRPLHPIPDFDIRQRPSEHDTNGVIWFFTRSYGKVQMKIGEGWACFRGDREQAFEQQVYDHQYDVYPFQGVLKDLPALMNLVSTRSGEMHKMRSQAIIAGQSNLSLAIDKPTYENVNGDRSMGLRAQ